MHHRIKTGFHQKLVSVLGHCIHPLNIVVVPTSMRTLYKQFLQMDKNALSLLNLRHSFTDEQ